MLVRPGSTSGLEVFMLRRSEASHFAPDVYVFPGGTVDDADGSDAALARMRGFSAPPAQRRFAFKASPLLPVPADLPEERDGRMLCVAAIRELFEEAGVLLACDADGVPVAPDRAAQIRARLHGARLNLCDGTMRLWELLAELDLYANAAALVLFSRWITPPSFPRRYDAYFFVAEAHRDQMAQADAFETHDGVWIAPGTALARHAEGSFRMVYPTMKHVERLATFDDVGALLAFARTKPIVAIMPHAQGEMQFRLPAALENVW